MEELFQGLVPATGKAALLYQAVLELLEEGRDITTMKVSDITSRAGIGKGTAYEYFSSREEIIVQAVLWDLKKMLREVADTVNQAEGFLEKYRVILDWIEKRLMRWCTFGICVQLQQKEQDCSSAFKREFSKYMPDEELLIDKMGFLVEVGRADGLIRPELSDTAVKYVLLSQIMTFILYLRRGKEDDSMTLEEVKQFSLDSFLKIVG